MTENRDEVLASEPSTESRPHAKESTAEEAATLEPAERVAIVDAPTIDDLPEGSESDRDDQIDRMVATVDRMLDRMDRLRE